MTHPGFGISLTWLLRLRWITAVGQTAAILAAKRLLPEELSIGPLLGLVAFGALSNAALMLRLRRPEPVRPALPGLVLGLDILLLTGLLYGSGGAANPFTAIYLVHITLAAVVMRGIWAWALGVLSISGFGLLFFYNVHVHSLAHMNHGGDDGISLHLVGMWVAFAITAGLIAAFVGLVTEALRRRDEELAALRDLTARQSRLAALTTLAAGVAHELGSPLGTIAVAAKELQRTAEGLGAPGASLAQDAALIREEVGRCRRILDQMAEPSGSNLGEPLQALSWGELEADLSEGLASEDRTRLAFQWPDAGCGPMPRRGLGRALRAVVANALEATPRPGSVKVVAREDQGAWLLEVEDQGTGMAPEVLARVGEPFFSTKPTGSGMGLGLFLARTFAEQLGGELRVESQPGQGTRVQLSWPQVARG
ncbi:MAG: HAMP domain-containing histidine kinase [Geothrix sp.]|uniref:sensor histidine kinase n=1 Tax=Geothrix sp. TaxID=1962974 RepID=UPI00184B6F87|nr:HAMP domain-containing sensor histidine kinase [Geothrix sp.]NWJ40987.1 HAMP domain-containing histidine kinase [Geothrix sp.]WIL21016.1 MAG: ATP-binding protein [Geothrix sp.]